MTNILDIRFISPVAVPGKLGPHDRAYAYEGVDIVRDGDTVRLSAGTDTVYVPMSAVLYYRAAEPVTKAKRGGK